MKNSQDKIVNYGDAIRLGFEYLLDNFPECFVMGQGLWSPWYVGNSMTDLDLKYGKGRIIDTPVSESACTGAAVGASLAGMKPIIVHPRMDFMLYAVDAIVNQAAKWSHMFGGQAHPAVTIRGIINRGGEQGAQHSQALHSWFAHVPGLRVVMPSTVSDARDLLISSVLCDDPVLYIDDRWSYESEAVVEDVKLISLEDVSPQLLSQGKDITIVGAGYSSNLALQAHDMLCLKNFSADVVDIRVLNPFDPSLIISSVEKTGRLLVVDGGWSSCGFAAEVITTVVEATSPNTLLHKPVRITLPNAPAPTARNLEKSYYFTKENVFEQAINIINYH